VSSENASERDLNPGSRSAERSETTVFLWFQIREPAAVSRCRRDRCRWGCPSALRAFFEGGRPTRLPVSYMGYHHRPLPAEIHQPRLPLRGLRACWHVSTPDSWQYRPR